MCGTKPRADPVQPARATGSPLQFSVQPTVKIPWSMMADSFESVQVAMQHFWLNRGVFSSRVESEG